MNISFITSNDFCRLGLFVFLMRTSKHKYQCFLILVQSFSACTFSRMYVLIQTFISLVIHFPFKGPDKKPQNKATFTATRSQECLPTNCHQPKKLFLARCHRGFVLIE